MYRLIFLLLFSFPIHGMLSRPLLDLDFSTPPGVLQASDPSSDKHMITITNGDVTRTPKP